MKNMKHLCLLALVACGVGEYEDYGDDGEDEPEDAIAAAIVDPTNLNVGFNNGFAVQFQHFPAWFAASKPSPARLCHAYVQWNVANQAPWSGSVADHSTRAFIDDWLQKAQGKCDEALISFKSMK